MNGSGELIELGSNECALGPALGVADAMKRVAGRAHRYPRERIDVLRSEIAERANVGIDNVVVSNGSAEVLLTTGATSIRRGDTGVMSRPTFYLHVRAVERPGGRPVFVETKDYHQDLSGLVDAITSRTRLVIVTNPHSPTGTYIDVEAMDDLVRHMPQGVTLVIDEAYGEYATAADYPDTTEYVRRGFDVVITRTFSKAYGLAGMRIGYGIAPPERIKIFTEYLPPFHTNSASVEAALAGLADQDHLQRVVELNASERVRLAEALRGMGLSVVSSQANFVLVTGLDNPHLTCKRLESAGIIVRPTEVEFGLPGGLRITTGTSDQNNSLLDVLGSDYT